MGFHTKFYYICSVLQIWLNRPYIIYICIFASWLLFLPSCTTVFGEKFKSWNPIDAGHGGHDRGYRQKSLKKNINLNVALKVEIKKNCDDVKLIYTRSKVYFIPLARRAEIANVESRSFHLHSHQHLAANSRAAKGASTGPWVWPKSEANLEVAKQENAVILYESDYETNMPVLIEFCRILYHIRIYATDKYMEQSVHLASWCRNNSDILAKRVGPGRAPSRIPCIKSKCHAQHSGW